MQLYALSLTEALGKNTGIEIHRELASRAFTQGLEKLITDRVRHSLKTAYPTSSEIRKHRILMRKFVAVHSG